MLHSLPWGYPTPWGGGSTCSTGGSTIHGVELRRRTLPQIAVATGEDHHLSSGYGVTGEKQPDWTVHGDLEENFGKKEGVGLKKKSERSMKTCSWQKRSWGNGSSLQIISDDPFYQWDGVFGLIHDSIEKNLNRYREKYKHDLCSLSDWAQYMQAPMCMFVSKHPQKAGEDWCVQGKTLGE